MELRFEQSLAVPRDVLFHFHTDPANLGRLMERRRGFRLLRHDGSIQPGCETWVVDEIARLPVTLGFRHVRVEPPELFEERLFHGPFEHFVHCHRFETEGDSTRVIDELDVRLPWWLGGELGLRKVVRSHLQAAFAFRQRELLRLVREDLAAESVPV